jgi:hypothetical protein
MVYWVAFKIVFSYLQELVEQQKNKGGTLFYTAICELTTNRYYRHIYSPEGTVFIVYNVVHYIAEQFIILCLVVVDIKQRLYTLNLISMFYLE